MTQIKTIEGGITGKKFKPQIHYRFLLNVPQIKAKEFALLIEHDGQNDAIVNSMLRLADEGKAPYTVVIGLSSGKLTMPNGEIRDMRLNSYDYFDREFGDFIVYELIPYVEKTYGIKFSKSPDMHMLSGGSSGGISAFTVAWFHSDYFHRVYMSSPSFLAMGRGNEIPCLLRKFEAKPIKIYEEYSENEPNDYFGWSKGIDEETYVGLYFAGYDYKSKFFPGEGHCSRYKNEEEAYLRNAWLWENYQTPVAPRCNSKRLDKIVPFGTGWEKCDVFPDCENTVANGLLEMYDKVVLSNDNQAFYAANQNDDTVYMHLNGETVNASCRTTHAYLHTIPKQKIKGAIDMAVDKTDRLFVLTQMGIQCVRSYGLIDAILNLPDSAKPLKIAVTDALYVETESGVYRRPLNEECITDSEEKRKQISYYD